MLEPSSSEISGFPGDGAGYILKCIRPHFLRLTNVVGIECVDEPSAPAGITVGEWGGEDDSLCLFVAEDGKSLTTVGSTCVNTYSMWLDIPGIKVTLDGSIDPAGCKVDASCTTDPTIDPETGYFQCVTALGTIEGWFTSATGSWGHASQTVGGGLGNACVTEWNATPKP